MLEKPQINIRTFAKLISADRKLSWQFPWNFLLIILDF